MSESMLKEVEKYAAGVNAWYNTSLEHDKSLLTLSTLGIGLLITLLTSVGVSSAEGLVLNILAIFSFLVCMASVLVIFKKNGSYLKARLDALESAENKPLSSNDPILGILDNAAIVSFALGVVFSSIIGISTAVSSYTNKEKIMTDQNKSQEKVVTLRESLNNAPLIKKSFNSAPITPDTQTQGNASQSSSNATQTQGNASQSSSNATQNTSKK